MPAAKRRQFRNTTVAALVLFGLSGIVVNLPLWRTMRQQHLNHMLVGAIWHNDTHSAVALLQQGADPNCREQPEWRTSVWQTLYARIRGKHLLPIKTLTAIQLVTRPKEEFDDLLDAPDLPQNSPDNVELIRALLEHGADPNTRDPQGFTPLLYAIRWQKRATADLLLTHGADPDQGDRNRVTPLMVAVYMADARAIRQLLDHGAHIDRQDDISGQTALMLAVMLKRPACITALMIHHPDLTVRDHNGKTALYYASKTGYRARLIRLK